MRDTTKVEPKEMEIKKDLTCSEPFDNDWTWLREEEKPERLQESGWDKHHTGRRDANVYEVQNK